MITLEDIDDLIDEADESEQPWIQIILLVLRGEMILGRNNKLRDLANVCVDHGKKRRIELEAELARQEAIENN